MARQGLKSFRRNDAKKLLVKQPWPDGSETKMTAEVVVMNRSAVALAADSAVTIEAGDSIKVHNTANKLFTLSKYWPIGIMFYGSADFMHIPWETIIKEFREELGNKKYTKADGYARAFIRHLNTKVPCSQQDQKQRAYEIWRSQLDVVDLDIHSKLLNERQKRPLDESDVKAIIRSVISEHLEQFRNINNARSMSDIPTNTIVRQHVDEYREAKQRALRGRPLTPDAERKLKELCALMIKKF